MQINCLLLFCFTCFFFFSGSLSAQNDKIYETAKYVPIYPGCELGDRTITSRKTCSNKKIEKFLIKNFNYPNEALTENIEGEVIVGFVVEKDGRISNIAVEQSLCSACDDEGLRLVGLLPNFVPGREKMKPLRVKSQLIVPFVSPDQPDSSEKGNTAKGKSNEKERRSFSKRNLTRDRINRLNKGVLVIKLTEPNQKYKALKKLLGSAKSPENKEKYKQQLSELEATTNQQNKDLVRFFGDRSYYSFSDVVFIYERAIKDKKIELSDQFLNSDLQPDPSISIAGREFFVTNVGTTPRTEDSRTVYKAFVTRAPEGGVLSAPFPAYITWIKSKQKSKTRIRFNGILNSELSVGDAVIKFDSVLKHFYQKMNE